MGGNEIKKEKTYEEVKHKTEAEQSRGTQERYMVKNKANN